jgi:hypothetical protein
MTLDPNDVHLVLETAAQSLERDRDASIGESADFLRGMTRAIRVLRALGDLNPPTCPGCKCSPRCCTCDPEYIRQITQGAAS